jgi:hypothetical protein
MVYVTAMPHPTVRHMRKTTFVCYTCHQTRSYMLSSLMADLTPLYPVATQRSWRKTRRINHCLSQ